MSIQRNAQADARAKRAAEYIRGHFRDQIASMDKSPIGILFSSGLDRFVHWDPSGADQAGLPYDQIPGFEALDELGMVEGHGRRVHLNRLNGQTVLWLEGRLHLNENPFNPGPVHQMVRLQMDMLSELGVTTFIVTSVVGTTTMALQVGQVGVVKGFLNSGGDVFTGCAGEFPKLDAALDPTLQQIAISCSGGFMAAPVVHYFVHGPSIETDRQKDLIASWGAHVVGMSMQPEADALARQNAKMVGLAYVVNGYTHSHKDVLVVVDEWGDRWMQHLTATVSGIVDHRVMKELGVR